MKEERKDKEVICVDCNRIFIYTIGEQEFYEAHQFPPPKRCKPCREQKKANMQNRNNNINLTNERIPIWK